MASFLQRGFSWNEYCWETAACSQLLCTPLEYLLVVRCLPVCLPACLSACLVSPPRTLQLVNFVFGGGSSTADADDDDDDDDDDDNKKAKTGRHAATVVWMAVSQVRPW